MPSIKSLFTVASLLAAVSVNAQGPLIPTCAQPCVSSLLGGGSGSGCDSQAGDCICTNTELIANLSCCVFKSCDAAAQEQTVTFARNICGTFGVQGTIPDQASCPSSSSAAPSSSSSDSTIGNISTMLGPGPVVVSTSISGSGSAATPTTSSSGGGASESPVGSPIGSPTESAGAQQTTGAAVKNELSAAGALAAVVGGVALML